MKKIAIIASVIILSSQSKVLNIKNTQIEQEPSKENNTSFIEKYRSPNILPISTSLGQLEDYYLIEKDIFKTIEGTLNSILIKEMPNTLNETFTFLYRNYYFNDLFEELDKPLRWNIGMGLNTEYTAEYKVELIFKNIVLAGDIYLNKNDKWLVTDLQLSRKEKESFDPLTPFILY